MEQQLNNSEHKMLAKSGYGERAIKYYMEKAFIGSLDDANHVSENIGSCGDTMKIYLKIENDIIKDARYEILGCAGAISSAMAMADMVRGKSISYALSTHDGDVFNVLENVPEKKHHCIQLAVKTMHKGLKEYRSGQILESPKVMECPTSCEQQSCCKKT